MLVQVPGTVREEKVEDAEQSDLCDVICLSDDLDDQEEDLRDDGFDFEDDIDGEVDSEVSNVC